MRFLTAPNTKKNEINQVNFILYQINTIQSFPIKSALRGGPRDLTLQIGVIGYYDSYVIVLLFFTTVHILSERSPNRDTLSGIGIPSYLWMLSGIEKDSEFQTQTRRTCEI